MFDFNNPIDLETRVEYLKELHAIYCISYNHTVPQNEDDESNFKGHITTIKYEQLLRLSMNLKLTAHKNKSLNSSGQCS